MVRADPGCRRAYQRWRRHVLDGIDAKRAINKALHNRMYDFDEVLLGQSQMLNIRSFGKRLNRLGREPNCPHRVLLLSAKDSLHGLSAGFRDRDPPMMSQDVYLQYIQS